MNVSALLGGRVAAFRTTSHPSQTPSRIPRPPKEALAGPSNDAFLLILRPPVYHGNDLSRKQLIMSLFRPSVPKLNRLCSVAPEAKQNPRKEYSMNTKSNFTSWSWLQLPKRWAARVIVLM